jgi:predicted ATPase/DNA-binding SARP family transcriptional activator
MLYLERSHNLLITCRKMTGVVMLEVRLLGQFEVLRDGQRLFIPTRNAQSLFAYLILHAGKFHRRELLAGLLWPDSNEENARSNLRHELWRLRKSLDTEGESYFLVDNLTIAFSPQSEVSVDVHRLENVSLGGSTTEELISALSSYQGELLPGFYDEWVFIERNRLAALFEARIDRLLEDLQASGRWEEVLEWGLRWIAMGQLPEAAYRAMMTAYANTGDLSKAVATYESLAKGLQNKLGVKPSEQTLALYKRLKIGWRLNTPAQAPGQTRQPPISMVDQPAPTLTLPKMRHSNLPKPMTSFIGREKEIQQVEHLVSQAKLVTIIGSGGVGKTRLAIEIASVLTPRYKDGVWWVELAALLKTVHFDLVAQAVAKALRIPESPGLPIVEEVVEHLHDKQLLLVLDNCEHLIEDCSSLTERLLADCPGLTILATSREALGVSGEKAWLLSSLSLPDQGHSLVTKDIIRSEAVSLFVERAADVLPGYQLDDVEAPMIVQICHRLGGIPLAIELAAARMNLLSAQEIAARLDSRFSLLTGGRRTALPRHQTLQGAIEWSYDLLSDSEQLLFRRLAIFAGSFTLEAAEEICSGDGIKSEDVLTLTGRLVGKSLLYVVPVTQDTGLPTRYIFLDTICSFGRLKLERAEETRWMRDRHTAYYVRLVEDAEPELLLENQVYWFKFMQAENDNLRAVIEWSAKSDQAESALRLVGAMLWFWFSYGSTHEGRDLALKALAIPSGVRFDQMKKTRARALNTAGFLLYLLGDTDLARQTLEEALSIQRTLEDNASLAWSLQFLGLVLAYDQEYDLADATFQEGLALTRKLGGIHTNNFLHFLGDICLQKGDYFRAQNIYEESVNVLRAIGSKSFLAYPLRRLGYLALEENDIPKAKRYFKESLAINIEVGDKRAVAASLTSLAALAISINRQVVAASLYGVVEHRLESLSVNLLFTDQSELGHIHSKLSFYFDEKSYVTAFKEGWEMSEEDLIDLVGGLVAGEDE